MWRKLSILLLFITLVQSAYALPSLNSTEQSLPFSNPNNSSYVSNTHQVSKNTLSALKLGDSFGEKLSNNSTNQAITVEEESNDELYTLPRIVRASASTFTTELQASPDYVLVIEFFAIKLTAGLFRHLANPPLVVAWFEQLGAKSTSSRISGWKDSNLLYKSSITYLS